MIVSVQKDIELDLPPNWRELPPNQLLARSDWICEWVEETSLPLAARGELATGLRRAAEFVVAHGAGVRTWIVIVEPLAAQRVVGLASVVALANADATTAGLAERLVRAPLLIDDAEVWTTNLEPARCGVFPALVAHEFLGLQLSSRPRLTERYVGTVFPQRSVAVQLELTGASAESFDDIVATGNAVLGSIRVGCGC